MNIPKYKLQSSAILVLNIFHGHVMIKNVNNKANFLFLNFDTIKYDAITDTIYTSNIGILYAITFGPNIFIKITAKYAHNELCPCPKFVR